MWYSWKFCHTLIWYFRWWLSYLHLLEGYRLSTATSYRGKSSDDKKIRCWFWGKFAQNHLVWTCELGIKLMVLCAGCAVSGRASQLVGGKGKGGRVMPPAAESPLSPLRLPPPPCKSNQSDSEKWRLNPWWALGISWKLSHYAAQKSSLGCYRSGCWCCCFRGMLQLLQI